MSRWLRKQSPYRFGALGVLVMVLCLGLAVRSGAEGEDDFEDLDTIESPNRSSSGKDDALAELDQVIQEEESRELGETSQPRSASRSAPSDDDFEVLDEEPPPSRRGREDVPPPAEDLSLNDDEALGVPDLEEPPPREAKNNSGSDAELEELEALEASGKDSQSRGSKAASAASEFDDMDAPAGEFDDADLLPPAEDFTEQGQRSTAADDFAQVPGADPGTRNQINNLEFKMDGKNSRVVISSRSPLSYREVKNGPMKQVVYFFENTTVPEKLQRAYDTTEFPSPVALFTLLQVSDSPTPTSKLIVQMREDTSPSVIPSDRGMVLEFGPPTTSNEPRLVIGRDDDEGSSEENIYSGGQSFSGRLIRRLEIKNSEVQDVLRLIARTSGYNIVVGDDVTGQVGTLSLENLPWDQAFALVLQSKKLGYVRQGNVLRVATLASLQQEKADSLSNEQAKILVEPLKTVLIPVSYARAGELAPRGAPFLTPSRGTIETDARTNTIIVKDIRSVVDRLQKLFAALDTQPPRVSISARFVEMRTDFTRDIGFDSVTFDADLAGINVVQSVRPGATGGVASTTITASDFANLVAQFNLAETENRARILSNPSVSVVANAEAQIAQAFNLARTVAVPNAGGLATLQTNTISARLELRVTPIVAGDGTIFLTINLRNEIPTSIPSTADGQVTIDSRELTTQVLIENGDTAVVGNIFSNQVVTRKSGVPFLMRFPILGFFFSSDSFLDNRNEVFVFLTAKIMNAEEAFKRTL